MEDTCIYLRCIDRGGVQHIEPAKSVLDVHCEFAMETEANGPWNGAHCVNFSRQRELKYAGIANSDGHHNMEAAFNGRKQCYIPASLP